MTGLLRVHERPHHAVINLQAPLGQLGNQPVKQIGIERYILLNAATAPEQGPREREATLRDLIQTLDLAAVMIRQWSGEISFWSRGCEVLYGWKAEDFLGERPMTFFAPSTLSLRPRSRRS